MMQNNKKTNFALPEWSVPVMLLILCGICYGILLPDMGFYWDDWPSAWFNHSGGAVIFPEAFASDRPLLGWLFSITMRLMGSSILRWQIFGVFTHWLAALAFWGLLRITWPGKPREALWAASIFAVYPAFTQQWIAITYSHVFLVYAVFIASLILTYTALRKPGWYLPATAAALVLSALAMFTAEYFIGLEILRPLLVWLALNRDDISFKRLTKSRLWQALKTWLPYLILLMVFFVWRVFIHAFPRGQIQAPSAVNAPPSGIGAMVSSILSVIVQDCLEVSIGTWGIVFHPTSWLAYNAAVVANGLWIVAVILGIGFAYYSCKINLTSQQNSDHFGKIAVIIGLLSLVAGGMPFWAINLPYKADFPNDRTALPMIFGASLLVVGLIDLGITSVRAKSVLIAILIAGAFCHHYNAAASYVKENEDQRAFFWQVYWRIPDLAPGTALITDGWPFKYNTDNSFIAPLNWIYDQKGSKELKLAMIDLSARLGNRLPGLRDETTGRVTIEKNQPIQIDYRAFRFDGNTNRMVAFIHRPPACLHILDPQRDGDVFSYPETLYDILPFSDPGLILPRRVPDRPSQALFGKEQKKDWCLYFEEADLARQQQKWDEIVKIGKAAFDEHHLRPIDAGEYLPFIEGYAHAGDLLRAGNLSSEAFERQRTLRPALCYLWQDLARTAPSVKTLPASRTLGCFDNEGSMHE